MQIIELDASSKHLVEVQGLADANADRFGFYPWGAFARRADGGEILIAIEGEALLGYLMFRSGSIYATIEHLCVAKGARRMGVGGELVRDLIKRTSHLAGLDLHCRRDYTDSLSFYRAMNFQPLGEKVGRGKDTMALTHMVLHYGKPDLLDDLFLQQTGERIVVAIDTNVFIDLEDANSRREKESLALKAPWLQGIVHLHVTDEVFTDLDRNEDKAQRNGLKNAARSYPRRGVAPQAMERSLEQVKRLLGEGDCPQDVSDRKHLAYAIAGGVRYFVTRDSPFLAHCETVAQQFGIEIVRPAQLITEIDSVRRVLAYEPAALVGTSLRLRRVTSDQVRQLASFFINSRTGERSGSFDAVVHNALADPDGCEVLIVTGSGDPLALVVVQPTGTTVSVPLFRVRQGRLAPTLARCLSNQLSQISVARRCSIVAVTDAHLPEPVAEALAETGFTHEHRSWRKLTVRGVVEASDLGQLCAKFGLPCDSLERELDEAMRKQTATGIVGVEKRIWPGRVNSREVTTYIVPIQPRWAEHLFDEQLAKQGLFGADAQLALNHENVYYRTWRGDPKVTPARLLWYVSKSRLHPEPGIRAVSHLDEIAIGPASRLFRRFQRLGVYRWRDVLAVARGRADADIMAMRFSATEVLRKPVPRHAIRAWCEGAGYPFPPLSTTYRIQGGSGFADLYRMSI